MDLRLRAAQETCPDLGSARAEEQCRGDAAPVGDTARRNDRNLDRVDDDGRVLILA
jgi:hypothetical protein